MRTEKMHFCHATHSNVNVMLLRAKLDSWRSHLQHIEALAVAAGVWQHQLALRATLRGAKLLQAHAG